LWQELIRPEKRLRPDQPLPSQVRVVPVWELERSRLLIPDGILVPFRREDLASRFLELVEDAELLEAVVGGGCGTIGRGGVEEAFVAVQERA
jgi:hypothetical protein